MANAFRTSAGGRINRGKTLEFHFDGQIYQGYEGDTLASALLANGVHLMGRSFKYHRPRGVQSAGAEEPNALVGVGGEEARYTPNLRATQVEIYNGLQAESQNKYGSLKRDFGAINDALGIFFPAGFYYKTFMWPKSFWKRVYEPVIREAAGLGRPPKSADADRYTQHYVHTDVLVVGSGPAGLAAALAAAASGKKVLLCDEQAEFGGTLLHDLTSQIEGRPAQVWLKDTLASLQAMANVTLLNRTTAFGYYPHNFVALAERVTEHLSVRSPFVPRERLHQVRAGEIVFATGSIERPLAFPENDRPGILMAEAARVYANRYGVLVGRKVVVFTATDSAYRAALDLKAAGSEIAVIVDLRSRADGVLPQDARKAGIKVVTGHTITGTRGRLRVARVTYAPVRDDGSVGDDIAADCDAVIMSGGWNPTLHLFSQSRGTTIWDERLKAFLPGKSMERERSAGASRGLFGLAEALNDGYAKGLEAAGGGDLKTFSTVEQDAGIDAFIGATPHNRKAHFVKAFVDPQNDVTAKDIKLATREGMRSIEHVKRYTTTGMATDQGKTSNINALAIVSKALDVPIPQVGHTTFRPPYTPTSFGLFAGHARGDLFEPVRRTPIDSWAQEHGAKFEDAGIWKRAWYFPKADEDIHAAVARECLAVRQSVGLFDASTLGKIEVVGPDAVTFMERMFVNPFARLGVGKLRYGILLGEDGFIRDDGVIGRVAQDRFHVTTTTSGAPRVLHMMEDYLQTEWPDLDVWVTSTTEQWATIAVQGPNSRKVIAPLVSGVDLSPEAFPHMSGAECSFLGLPCRLWRVSFTGETGFEINVPAEYGRAAWEAIYASGLDYGITPYGTETMHVLRAEKGYLIVGQETDGTVTPDDAGYGWAIGKAKPDFVGKRSLARPAMAAADRKQLVGLLTTDPHVVLEEGAQIVADPKEPKPMTMLGHVTSSYHSATLGRSVALALVRGGRARKGTRLYVPMENHAIEVDVTDPVFYDPKGERLNG